MSIYYTVYVTTNLINNKIYVGVHKTSIPYDDYLGSGELLKTAIKKYGKDNFKKQIIAIFEDRKSAYQLEAVIINQSYLDQSRIHYNIRLGGDGGWNQYNEQLTEEQKQLRCLKSRKTFNQKSIDEKQIIYKKISLKRLISSPPFLGRNHSEKTKQQMSGKTHQKGEGNSQYGKMWITNGIENTRINKEDEIPSGWKKGRTC